MSAPPVEMIDAGQPLPHGPFQDHAENADRDRGKDQRRPIADIGDVEQEIGAERAHHVERAMGEVDDVEHPEDHGEAETEQRVERAVDQSDQQLGVKGLHDCVSRSTLNTKGYFFNKGQVLLSSGVKASSAGMVAISL